MLHEFGTDEQEFFDFLSLGSAVYSQLGGYYLLWAATWLDGRRDEADM